MKRKIFIPLISLCFLIYFNACKPDCKKSINLKQEYKNYQSWYPYKEFDTLHFYRIPEQDTLIIYGSEYKYPYYLRIGACDCCDDEKNEYLQQSFKDIKGNYSFNLEMDYTTMKFNMFGNYRYSFNFNGDVELYENVVTPDSTYSNATRGDYWIQSCFYAPRIGVIKYKFDSTHVWYFLRNF